MGAEIEIRMQEGVYISEKTLKNFSHFEEDYINIRTKEQRILSIAEIQRLPYADSKNPHYLEWKLRQKNIERLLKYLQKKTRPLRILDIGCGNGFMAHLMADNSNKVIGLDVNLTELKQAAIAFPHKSIKWYYLDILNESLPEAPFDIITFCASFQYFKEAKKVLSICKSLLTKKGEIHIIDSPFYNAKNILKAAENSRQYFNNIGMENMTMHYHHQTFEVLEQYKMQLKYKPNSWTKKILRTKDSPFPWIKLM